MNSPRKADPRGIAVVSALSVFALAVHGYHPYAEDGGVYVAGIKRVLDPTMYGPHADFVTAPMHVSFFAPFVASLVRTTHLPLPWMLLALYCTSLWLTLYAGWMLISRCADSLAERAGAIALLGCWLTLPIAGTSLMLMDPYVTARSLSTPLVLLALTWTIDDGTSRVPHWLLAALTLTAAALLHPLMAGYGFAAALLLACNYSPSTAIRRWGPCLVAGFALATALLIQATAPAESPEYVRIAMTRYYWFPLRWEWYEQAGLLAPFAILFALGKQGGPPRHALARTGTQLGAIGLLVAALFARPGLRTHLVARLQPLRSFQIVYELMILLLGAWLAKRWLHTRPWRWAALISVCGGAMFFVQRGTYPASNHLELPWQTPSNAWEQAFLWAREHTPRDAVFALDAHYITLGKGEDAQCFRAIAERDALPDYSKDGGEASIAPSLTQQWVQGQAAQTNFEEQNDPQRAARLKPLGASWTVLQSSSHTAWDCPYRNATVKVCLVP